MSLNQQPFFNPYFSRVPLHRQFLQESTDKRSSTIVTKLWTNKSNESLSSQYEKVGFMKLRRTKVNVEFIIEELHGLLIQDHEPSENLTMMALTMSLLLFFRARIAFARETLACDTTSSMSLTSTPVSSTYYQKTELVHSDMCTSICLRLVFTTTARHLFFFALLLYCWRLCVFLDARYGFSLDLELLCRSQLSLLGKIFDLEHAKQKC